MLCESFEVFQGSLLFLSVTRVEEMSAHKKFPYSSLLFAFIKKSVIRGQQKWVQLLPVRELGHLQKKDFTST